MKQKYNIVKNNFSFFWYGYIERNNPISAYLKIISVKYFESDFLIKVLYGQVSILSCGTLGNFSRQMSKNTLEIKSKIECNTDLLEM